MASLKELHQIREKIADLKATAEREKNRGLSENEIADLIDRRVDGWAKHVFDAGYLGINIAHSALDTSMVLRAAVSEGDDKVVAMMAWLFPDQLKQRLTEAALPFAYGAEAKLDVRKLEEECYDLEVAEEKLYCRLEESGINPGPRRPDADPLIIVGVFV